MIPQYNFEFFMARLIGKWIVPLISSLFISILISLILYFIFRKVAKKYKNYLDYFTIVFVLVSILITFGSYRVSENAKNLENNKQFDKKIQQQMDYYKN